MPSNCAVLLCSNRCTVVVQQIGCPLCPMPSNLLWQPVSAWYFDFSSSLNASSISCFALFRLWKDILGYKVISMYQNSYIRRCIVEDTDAVATCCESQFLQKKVFIELPPEDQSEEEGNNGELAGSLYGTRGAPMKWPQYLTDPVNWRIQKTIA